MHRGAHLKGWGAAAFSLAFMTPAAVAVIMLTALPAAAADASTVGYGPSAQAQCSGADYCWSPSSMTINPGDSVTFSAVPVSYHALNELTGAWPTSCPQGSVGSCAFPYSGTYTFNCHVHYNLMKGTIVVTGNVHPPVPSPTPTHTTPPAPAPTQSQVARPTPSPSPSPQPTPSPSPSPTPEAVALADSPTPSDAGLPTPAPAIAATPASSTSSSGPGSPLPIVLLVLGLAALAGGGLYWYRERRRA